MYLCTVPPQTVISAKEASGANILRLAGPMTLAQLINQGIQTGFVQALAAGCIFMSAAAVLHRNIIDLKRLGTQRTCPPGISLIIVIGRKMAQISISLMPPN